VVICDSAISLHTAQFLGMSNAILLASQWLTSSDTVGLTVVIGTDSMRFPQMGRQKPKISATDHAFDHDLCPAETGLT
jgi:hypothetical protein